MYNIITKYIKSNFVLRSIAEQSANGGDGCVKKDTKKIPSIKLDISWQGRRDSDEVLRSIAEQSAIGGDGCVKKDTKKNTEY